MSSLCRLQPDKCVLLVCDIQERFRPAIHSFANVITGAQRMMGTAKELQMPVIVTEQYPKGLLHTVEELDLSWAKESGGVFEKTMFSMITPEVQAKLDALSFTDAIIIGLETHVCVQQTTLDLLSTCSCNVHLCVDAISSQQIGDRACGIRRAERAGAFLTTTESVMMELIRSKDHPSFKAVSGMLKGPKYAEPQLSIS